LLKANESITVG
jgi:hypothetical protein